MRCAVYVAAAALVSLQALGRLLNGSHWLSDVVASVLLAFAWALGASALRRLPHKVTGMILVLASLAFFVFDDLPATRFGLPSALDESRPALVSVEFGTPEARAVLGDGWEDGPAEPVGPVSWATSPDVSATLRMVSGREGILKVTSRHFRRQSTDLLPHGRLGERIASAGDLPRPRLAGIPSRTAGGDAARW
jgi:hypothetical protein